MRLKRRMIGLFLAAALLVSAAGSTCAAGYSDLPESHWAYEDMSYAVFLGILNGVGNGKMAPSASLSWGQCLAMVTRAFAPDAYQAAVNSGLAWDQAGLAAAREVGLVLAYDFLPVEEDNLSKLICRQDVAVLLDRVLPASVIAAIPDSAPSAEELLADWDQIAVPYRKAVSDLVALKIIQGKPDSTFGGTDILQRCDGSAILVRTIKTVDLICYYDEMMTVTFDFVDLQGQPIEGEIEMNLWVGSYTSGYLFYGETPSGYEYDYEHSECYPISRVQDHYTITLRPLTELELEIEAFWDKVARGEADESDYYMQDFWLRIPDGNPRKYLLLFGDESKYRFTDKAEAQANMVTVSVPVWKLSNGAKVSATASLRVHAALAEDVKEIFTEIYNDPEQFPIYSVGGFAWRGDSSTSEHNCGTAIDINPNENYQIRYGKIQTGSLWDPENNPYSIGPYSSVVRIFEEHGWSWGGDAWAWDSDPSEGYHDYMHFSYLGG